MLAVRSRFLSVAVCLEMLLKASARLYELCAVIDLHHREREREKGLDYSILHVDSVHVSS
jgi:hypothetical protein